MDEKQIITIRDCIETAGKSPLVRPGESSAKEFYNVLRGGSHDDGSDWHKTSAAGHLARTFLGMLQTAQDEGVTPRQIHLAIQVELERHEKATREYTPRDVSPSEMAGASHIDRDTLSDT